MGPPAAINSLQPICGDDYGIDDDGLTICPTPQEFTPYAISLFLPQSTNHLYITSNTKEGRCFMFIDTNYTLPKGLAIVYDRPCRLKWYNKLDKKEKGHRNDKHFSLICTEKMIEEDYLEAIAKVFRLPQMNVCRVYAGSGLCLEKFHRPDLRFDGGITTIVLAIEHYYDIDMASIDEIALHNWSN